jgi:hypothetical protein
MNGRALHSVSRAPRWPALSKRQEGKEAVPPIWKDPTVASYRCPTDVERRIHRDDVAEGEEERCNTRSTFETSKYNSCNIRLKVDETLKTCF